MRKTVETERIEGHLSLWNYDILCIITTPRFLISQNSVKF